MQDSDIPTKIQLPWGASAGGGYIRSIPVASQIGVNDGYASFTDGFVPLNATPEGAGGIPPFIQDENGILNQITAWIRWINAGAPITYDSTFQTNVGGYPKGSVVASATTLGTYWLSTADNNTTNPDTGGAGWVHWQPGGGAYVVDSGAPNALVVTPSQPLGAYFDGATYLVDPAHANTGATTINVSGLGTKPIVHTDGTALNTGEIQAGSLMRISYLGGSFQWLDAPYAPTQSPGDATNFPASTAFVNTALGQLDFFAGQIYGLTMSNTGGSSTTSISVSAGQCRDSTNAVFLNLVGTFAKLITSNWASGTGNGGNLDGTSLAAGQTWFFHAIAHSDGTSLDFGFSQSPTAPPLPSGYGVFRRLGAVVLDAAATTIRLFIQHGDDFMLVTRSADYAATSNGGLIAYYRAITVPVGIVVWAYLVFQSNGTVDGNPYFSGVYDPAFGSPPAFGVSTQWAQIRRSSFAQSPSGTYANYGYEICGQYTDASGHIYTRSSDNLDSIALGVLGWKDTRGRLYPG